MSTRLSIYSKAGVKLTEIDVNFKRTWKISDYGQASFTIAITDAKAIIDYLQFGNFIYAEHDKLPVWGGMIDTPREWGLLNIIVNCYSGEYLLTQRITEREVTIAGSPGAVFSGLIEQANIYNQGAVMIRPGEVWGGDGTTSRIYHYESLYDRVKDHCKANSAEWNITPAIDSSGNNLYFQANFYKKMGMECLQTLYEDRHIELGGTPLREQGEIINSIVTFGGGSTYYTIIAMKTGDQASVDKYGFRRKSFWIGGNDAPIIAAAGNANIAKYKEPRRTFDFNVADVGDIFHYLRPGNILPIELYTIGFTGASLGLTSKVRIMGMVFDDLSMKVNVIADEVL